MRFTDKVAGWSKWYSLGTKTKFC